MAKTKEVQKAESEEKKDDKPATKAEREQLGAAESGPLSEIGNLKPVEAPEGPAEPETEFVEDPAGKSLAFDQANPEYVVTTTKDDTYPQDRLQSVFTKSEGK